MPFKQEPMEEPHINLTPLVDIVFNLLLFLMLATRFAADEDAEQKFDVQLATAASARPLTALPDEMVVNVAANGKLQLNGKPRTLPELEAELVKAKKNYADQTVLIRGEGQGPYQNVVDVLAVCDRAKINVVSLPVRLKPEAHR
ncbi:MAG TPA: biopolymer transporter ExbD [Pirellulales bacterium]|jgi:biopolymer transport protein ExbD|nr:biopolymer transporter ExbD [Pirellulales bacterium]